MKDNNIYKADEHKVVVDERTGEATKLMRKHNAHTETDFFIMYLRPWLAASENDVSRKIKVFIHCIMCSSLSRASSADGEGNYFHVSDVIESVKKEDAEPECPAPRRPTSSSPSSCATCRPRCCSSPSSR